MTVTEIVSQLIQAHEQSKDVNLNRWGKKNCLVLVNESLFFKNVKICTQKNVFFNNIV